MSRLAERGHRVVYVDPTNMVPALKQSDLSTKRLEEINENIIVVRPLFLPFHYRLGLTERADGWTTTRLINRALRSFDSTRPDVIWTYSSYYNFMLSKWEGPLVVYDCVDACEGEFLKKRSNDQARTWLLRREEELIKRADAVFAVSKGLLDRAIRHNDNAFLMPNGTTLQLQVDQLPEDLGSAKRPMIGYVGNLGDWVDFELLDHLATARPEYSLVLVGPLNSKNEHIDALSQRNNVHLLGRRDFAQVPGYIASFDVCLIPFTIQTLTRMANPVKLFEYASLGKPIVSTPLDGVLEFRDLIYPSDGSKDGFVEQVDAALKEEDVSLRQRRMAMAKEHDWERITGDVESVLGRMIGHRIKGHG